MEKGIIFYLYATWHASNIVSFAVSYAAELCHPPPPSEFFLIMYYANSENILIKKPRIKEFEGENPLKP